MYKLDLALNYLQWLICNKNQPNRTKPKVVQKVFSLIQKVDITEHFCSSKMQALLIEQLILIENQTQIQRKKYKKEDKEKMREEGN